MKYVKILFIFSVILFLASCNQYTNDSRSSVMRIISLAPSNTEILFALGLDEEIVGVSSYCNFPRKASSKEKVGDFSNPNIEKIISLKPDIIFAAGLEQNQVVRKLKDLEQNVIVINPENFNELFGDIELIGKLTGKKNEALNLVSLMQDEINKITQQVKLFNDTPKVFIEINFNPLMTVSDGSFLDEMIKIAGGINIAGNLPRPYCRISEELVISQKPDVIIITHSPDTLDIKDRSGWENIPAVKNNNVYNDVNPDILVRPGPRLADGLEELFKRMYKGLKKNAEI